MSHHSVIACLLAGRRGAQEVSPEANSPASLSVANLENQKPCLRQFFHLAGNHEYNLLSDINGVISHAFDVPAGQND